MNILDAVFLLVLLFFCIRGFFYGIIHEIASILSFVLAFVFASMFYQNLEPIFLNFPKLASWAGILAYISCFLSVMLAVFISAFFLRRYLRIAAFGWVNAIGGGGIGLFKGAFLCAVFLFLLSIILPSKVALLRESVISPYISGFSRFLVACMPGNAPKDLQTKGKQLRREWYESFFDSIFPSDDATSTIEKAEQRFEIKR